MVAVDHNGQLYFENQIIQETPLQARLNTAVRHARQPMTLVLQADGRVSESQIVRLSEMARQAGIQDLWLATKPRGFEPSSTNAATGPRK